MVEWTKRRRPSYQDVQIRIANLSRRKLISDARVTTFARFLVRVDVARRVSGFPFLVNFVIATGEALSSFPLASPLEYGRGFRRRSWLVWSGD